MLFMYDKAIFGAGCFWGVEAAFRKLPGIKTIEVGFMGGVMEYPSYEDVVSGNTGHVEVVQIEFDTEVISYEKLLDLFWIIHDPTQLNRQGPDVGDQYRTIIFYINEEQQKLAEKSKQILEESGKYAGPIVTRIEPAGVFWKAEDYHQKYLEKNPSGYCHVNMAEVDKYIAELNTKKRH